VDTAGVVPVHPAQRGQLDVLDGLPGAGSGRSVDQFGLVVSVDRVLQHAITGGCTVPGGTHPKDVTAACRHLVIGAQAHHLSAY
jgi:hypothetical protein